MDISNVLSSLSLVMNKFSSSIGDKSYELIDRIILIGPDILTQEPLKNIFFSNKVNGVILIANSLIFFYSSYYIFSRILGMYNGQAVENVNYFILKLVIILILTNSSYYLCEQILNINELFSNAIDEFAEDIVGEKVNFENLHIDIMSLKEAEDDLSLEQVIKSIVSFMNLSLVITFAIRYVSIIFLIIISPFAFICLVSNITRGFSKAWGKSMLVNLLMQIAIKVLLVIPLSFKDKSSIMYKIVLLGTMYLLFRISSNLKELTAQISLPSMKRGD